MPLRSRLLLAAPAILFGGMLACGGPSEPAAEAPVAVGLPVPEGEPTWVGRAACAACHPSEVAAHAGSHHDLAMQEATAATVLGDFDAAEVTLHGVTTTFSTRGDRFVVRTEGAGGELADFEVQYVFGVDPLQQVLLEGPRGRLQAFTVAWDARPAAAGGQRWFSLHDAPVPSSDPLHWTGPYQTWNTQCAECHTTALVRGYDLQDDRYTTTFEEVDVSCEACHGPASFHVGFARGELAPWGDLGFPRRLGDHDGGAWVADPASGFGTRTPPRIDPPEIDVCGRCHAHRGVLTDDGRPGDSLHDTHRLSLLDGGLYHPDGSPQAEVFVLGSFLQSRMHVAGVTCSDCHDPHTLTLRAEGNALCTQCHVAARFDGPAHTLHPTGSEGSQCVDCHMPATTYMGVDARREHAFRVPRPDLAHALGTPEPCTGCHDDRDAAWASAVLGEAFGPPDGREIAPILHGTRRGDPAQVAAVAALVRDRMWPAIERATGVEALADHPSDDIGQVLLAATRDPDPLVRRAAVMAAERAPQAVRVQLVAPLLGDPVAVVRHEAARVLAPMPPEAVPVADRPALGAAVAAYEQSLRASSERGAAHLNLGNLALDRGERAAAMEAYRAALRVEPGFVPAAVNLADLLRAVGRDDEGATVLRESLKLWPDAADAHHALGLLSVRTGDADDVIPHLREAWRLAPHQARYAYVLAVALQASEPATARAVLRDALARHRTDRDLLVLAARLAAGAGDLEATLRWTERLVAVAPADPGIQAQARQLRAEAERVPGEGP